MKLKNRDGISFQNSIILVGIIVALSFVIIPLLLIGKFDYKSVDDFWYSFHGEQLIASGNSFFSVAKAVWVDTWDCYLTWQGTLFATFFTRMLESYFSTNFYWVVVFIMIPFIVFPEIFFAVNVLHKHLGYCLSGTLNIALIFIFLQLLTIPYPVEALYWLCGASYYTVFWGLGVIATTLFLQIYWKEEKTSIGQCVVLIIIEAMVALGNLITALVVFSIFSLFVFLAYLNKKKNKNCLLVAFLLFTLLFLVDVFAPGNGIRVTDDTYIAPFDAVFQSMNAAFKDLLWCFKMPFVWCIGIAIGFLSWPLIDERKCKYRFPLAFVMVLYLILTAHYVPSMYTLQIAGAGRIRNLERYFSYFFLFGSELYLLGYFKGLIVEKRTITRKSKIPVTLMVVFSLGLLAIFSLYKECNRTLTSYSAYVSLKTGQAEKYKIENEERIKILTDDSEPNPTIKMFSDPPYLLLFRDARDLEDVYEDYYGKESITVIDYD